MCRSIRGFVLILGVLFATAAQAQDDAQRAAIERLFRSPSISSSWFTPEFIATVPADKLAALINDMERRHGQLREVARDGEGFMARLERAQVPTRIALDSKGRIAGLRFEAAIPVGSLEDQLNAIAKLPGQTSVLVTTAGKMRAAHRPELALAVGSAAKLAILKAVADAVAAGRLAWDLAVPLDEKWRSLPTGILQDWPAGTPVTVATLASLMISISDNTATDALVHLVGRERIEALTPRNTPFLTTRELFVLKGKGNDVLRNEWRAADAAQRRKLLARLAEVKLPGAHELDPRAIDIEWFMSAEEVCVLLDATAALPAMAINPGLARKSEWRSVAFKGGSEPGVINYSTRLTARDGTAHCVAATWNQPGLSEEKLTELYRAILSALRS
jgi:beta-lactamase class A